MNRFQLVPKVMRRITAADGYLDLEMPGHALAELDAIEETGPFTAAVHFLRGEALKDQGRYDDAIEHLHRAAEMIPTPFNKPVWMSLSECFRHRGDHELAQVVQMFAHTPPVPDPDVLDS